MPSLAEYLSGEHIQSRKLFADAERAVCEEQWEIAILHFEHLIFDLEQHFKKEELISFPSLVSALEHAQVPIAVMYQEHNQIRRLLIHIRLILRRRDKNSFLRNSESLITLMNQHNHREENIIYHIAGDMLHKEISDVIRQMDSFENQIPTSS